MNTGKTDKKQTRPQLQPLKISETVLHASLANYLNKFQFWYSFIDTFDMYFEQMLQWSYGTYRKYSFNFRTWPFFLVISWFNHKICSGWLLINTNLFWELFEIFHFRGWSKISDHSIMWDAVLNSTLKTGFSQSFFSHFFSFKVLPFSVQSSSLSFFCFFLLKVLHFLRCFLLLSGEHLLLLTGKQQLLTSSLSKSK